MARGKLFGISSITYDFLNLLESVDGKNDIKDRPNTKLTNINANYFHCYFATYLYCNSLPTSYFVILIIS